MAKVPYLDFQAIKQQYSIHEIMEYTGLTFKKEGGSFRCECPVHKGGKRTLVVTPDETDEKGDTGVYYCFASKEGGDRVSLLAHVRDSKPYAVFKELHEKRPPQQANTVPKETSAKADTSPEEEPSASTPIREEAAERGFRPLPYLVFDDDAVRAAGLEPKVAEALGIGTAPRGYHKGRLAIPVRSADGVLTGYISVLPEHVKCPPKWVL